MAFSDPEVRDHTFPIHISQVNGLALSRDGGILISGSADRTLRAVRTSLTCDLIEGSTYLTDL